jgi:uncharacterized protein YjbJ (UPF0337 family)
MDLDRIEGNRTQFKGSAKQQRGKITDHHLDAVAGERDALLGKIQQYYGITREHAEDLLSEWQGRQKEDYFAK